MLTCFYELFWKDKVHAVPGSHMFAVIRQKHKRYFTTVLLALRGYEAVKCTVKHKGFTSTKLMPQLLNAEGSRLLQTLLSRSPAF